MKHVVVVEDDIDVFDAVDVEWAVATRVQADKDVLIVSGARSKPLDPSLAPVPGHIPTTSKMGIDATISDEVPRERYERIAYAYADKVRLDDVLGDGGDKHPALEIDSDAVTALSQKIMSAIDQEPMYFADPRRGLETSGYELGRMGAYIGRRFRAWA